jgi:hypothetical protein
MIISPKALQAALLLGSLTIVPSCANTDEENPVATPMNIKGQVEYSMRDLAKRLDAPLDTVVLSGARQVTWRSGALGCPEPGMNYTQALVPGSVIYLRVYDRLHAYHAKLGGEPFYCPRERVEQPVLDEGLDPT